MAIVIGVNAMIGAGIFTVPSALQATVGPAGIVTYALVIAAVICMALALARVSELYPQEGAFYTYAYAWGGKTAGLIASGLCIAGLIVAMALLTKITGIYLAMYFPSYQPTTLAAIVLSVLYVVNLAGAVVTQIGQVILLALTILPLVGITALCLTKASVSNLTPFAPYGFSHIFSAIKAVIFGFFGFESIPALFALLDEPHKTVPRAIIGSITIVGLLYLTFVSAIFLALPRELFTSSDIALGKVLLEVFPAYPGIVHLITIAIIITIIGTLHAVIWSIGTMVTSIVRVSNPHLKLPEALSLGIVTVLIAVFSTLFSSIDTLFSLAGACIVSAYLSAMVTLVAIPQHRSRTNIILGLSGIITALIILIFSLDGLFHFIA